MSEARDFTRALYPFLAAPAPAGDARPEALLAEVRASTRQKCRDTVAVRRQLLAEYHEQLIDAALAMAGAFTRGGKLLAFGNGGSATDAQDAALDCLVPPVPRWRSLPALALVDDVATLTAVGNDVGFENVFLRQIIAFGEPGDVALGFSTSGRSPNVLAALAAARQRGLVTIALAGNDGGSMSAAGAAIDHVFVAREEHIPRIQEGHATVWHALLEMVQAVIHAAPAAEAAAAEARTGGAVPRELA